MRIENPCYTGKEGRQHKGQHLIAADVKSDGFRRNIIVPYGRNRSSILGMYKISNQKNRNHRQYKNQGIVIKVRMDGNLTQPLGPSRKLEKVNDGSDDFSKSQGDNGQVVSPKAQHRNTDQKTKGRCHKTPAQKGNAKGKGHRKKGQAKGKKSSGIGPDGHKSGMPQRKLSKKSRNQVQRDRQNNINSNGHKKGAVLPV